MDWSRIDKEAKKCRKIVLYRENHNDDNLPLDIPKPPEHLTPLQKELLKPFGEQFYIAETIRREILMTNVDFLIANLPLSIVVLYTDLGLDAEYLNTLPKYRPQMPPKNVREKTEQELMNEDKAWADRKAIEPSLKRRKVRDQETFHESPFTMDEIVAFRVTPKGFRYVIKWKDFCLIDHTKQLAGLSEARYMVRNFWDKFFTCCFHGFDALEDAFPFARPKPDHFDHLAMEDYVAFLESYNYGPIVEDQQMEIADVMEDEQSEPEEPVPDLPPKRQLAIEAAPTAQDDRYKPDPRESELSEAPSSHDEFIPHSCKKRKRKSNRKKKPQKAQKSHEHTVSNQRPKRKARKSKLVVADPQDQVVAEESTERPISTRENEPDDIPEYQVQDDLVSEISEQAAPLDSSEEVSPEVPLESPSEASPSDPKDGDNVEPSVSDKKQVLCKYKGCDLKFANSTLMWAHHSGKHKDRKCPICAKEYTRQKYGGHLAVCLGQQHKITLANTCEACKVVFDNNKLKKAHVDKQKVKCCCSEKIISHARRRKVHKSCENFEVQSCPPI